MNDQAGIVAIDGPSASGKSTVARKVAAALGWIYVDSGSLYRGMTWHALEQDVDPADAGALIELMEGSEWEFKVNEGVMTYYIDGHYPGKALRANEVAAAVSRVAAVPEIREFISERLRGMTALGSLVIEGRDIGSVVFPNTPYKFYLDADPEERARRRTRDVRDLGEQQDADEVLEGLKRRDEMDSHRETAPLQVALGAEVVNTTGLSIDEVVERVLSRVRG